MLLAGHSELRGDIRHVVVVGRKLLKLRSFLCQPRLRAFDAPLEPVDPVLGLLPLDTGLCEISVYPQKGAIRVGTDADIVLLRDKEWTVSADQLAYNGEWTPYEGCEWSAIADTVIANGSIAARDHEVMSSPGDGDFLARAPRP